MYEVATNTSLELYRSLLRIRLVEDEIAARYADQTMRCPVHLSIGQEAIGVGVCHALETKDAIISNHRSHAHYLAKGGNLPRMVAEIYGKETGCSSGFGGSMHLRDPSVNFIATTPIVAGSIPVGVGVAFAAHMRGEDSLTVIFFGEGSTEEGVWSESINFAALHGLPVLFVCENNLYSCYSPMEVRQPHLRSRVAIAEAHGIHSIQGDGNEVENVHRLAQEAVCHVREKKGPCFLEYSTYRYREHCGPYVDPDGYRPEEEVSHWNARDPLTLQRNVLIEQGQYTPDVIEPMEAAIRVEIDAAFSFAEESPFPTYNPHVPIYAE